MLHEFSLSYLLLFLSDEVEVLGPVVEHLLTHNSLQGYHYDVHGRKQISHVIHVLPPMPVIDAVEGTSKVHPLDSASSNEHLNSRDDTIEDLERPHLLVEALSGIPNFLIFFFLFSLNL